MFDTYIFDCDGVLFDSLQANIEFYNALLTAFGKPLVTGDQIPYIHMATAEESVAFLFKGDPRIEDAQRLRQRMDYHRFIPYMKLAPGAREVLRILKNKGKKLAVCTNRSVSMKAILEYFELDGLFDCVVTALDVMNPKPDPEGLLLILETLGQRPEDVLYLGDTIIDQQAARGAGIPFAVFRCPDLQADYHIDSFEQILTLFPYPKGVSYADLSRN